MDWPFQRLFPVTELLEESKRIMRLLPVGGCYVPPDPATLGKSGSRGRCEVDRGLGSVKAPGHRSPSFNSDHLLASLACPSNPLIQLITPSPDLGFWESNSRTTDCGWLTRHFDLF